MEVTQRFLDAMRQWYREQGKTEPEIEKVVEEYLKFRKRIERHQAQPGLFDDVAVPEKRGKRK